MEYKAELTKQNLIIVLFLAKALVLGLGWAELGLALGVLAYLEASRVLSVLFPKTINVIEELAALKLELNRVASETDEHGRDILGLKMRSK